MKKLVNTLNLSHEEWLEWRKKGIGGSDASSVVGLNPWRSAVAVYLDKLGELEPLEDSEKMRVGRDLEDYVARRFEGATGKKVRRNNFMMVHDDQEFMVANIDREIVGENALLECKTTGSYGKKDWENGAIPAHYEIQCHHYMAVTGAERCYIAVLIGNEDFKWQVIERDEETIQALIQIEHDFWHNYVLAKEPPPPDGTEQYDEILAFKYAKSINQEIPLERSNIDQDIERINTIKTLTKELEAEKKLLEQTIKKDMAENEKAVTQNYFITWKPQTTRRIDTKRLKEEDPDLYEKYSKITTSRVLRIKEKE